MNKLILCVSLLFSLTAVGQTVSIIDFVKVKDNKLPEALFYYENNWKVYRDIALKSNYIVSYKVSRTSPDSIGNFDLILVTEFADSSNYQLAEERFQKIIKEIRPNGPIFMNDLKANDFRQNVFMKRGRTVFSSEAPARNSRKLKRRR